MVDKTASHANNPKRGDKSDKRIEQEKKARKKGLALPSWMQYKMIPSFNYRGVGIVEDEQDPDLGYDDRYLNKSRLNRMKDKEKAAKIKEEVKEQDYTVYLASGVEHPLPETDAQKRMMKRGLMWSREGPLLPKNPMESPKELRNSAVGKRAKAKLQDRCAEIAGKEFGEGREYYSTVVMVRTGSKMYQWACYVGTIRTETKGTGMQQGEGSRRAAPKRYTRRDYTIEKETIEKVSCPTCGMEKGQQCVNKRGEQLPLKKTHERRVTKYLVEVKGKDLSDMRGNKKFERVGYADY